MRPISRGLTLLFQAMGDPTAMSDSQTVVLVADVGGTNTRAALARGGVVQRDTIAKFRNEGSGGLTDILARFLSGVGDPHCAGVCVAMAGPVMDGVGRLTNLDWTVTREDLADCALAHHVAILNDLQAQGHAVDHIAEDNLRVLIPGPEAAPAKCQAGRGYRHRLQRSARIPDVHGPLRPTLRGGACDFPRAQ